MRTVRLGDIYLYLSQISRRTRIRRGNLLCHLHRGILLRCGQPRFVALDPRRMDTELKDAIAVFSPSSAAVPRDP